MDEHELRLDGNAAAGALARVFAVELTAARGRCASCGATGPLGAAHLYVGAGLVLRCQACAAVLMVLVEDGDRTWLGARGLAWLEVSAS